MRSIGDLATTTRLTRWVTCGAAPSRLSRIDVHDGHGAAICGPNMKLYASSVSLPPSNRSENRTGPSALPRTRSDNHTSELQARPHVACRLRLAKETIAPDA